MTKKIKWYMRMSNLQLILFILTPFTVGGSVAIHLSPLSNWWLIGIGIVDGFVGALRFFATDKDGNDIIDRFEK